MLTDAVVAVLRERERQVTEEHWSDANDDNERDQGELAAAAVCYALAEHDDTGEETPDLWPWSLDWWKPKSRRRNLVRAAALLIAEIDRLDRAEEDKWVSCTACGGTGYLGGVQFCKGCGASGKRRLEESEGA